MVDTPDAVLLYVPLMKGLGMSWKEIKETPRHELEGLLAAYSAHEQFHSMDGYDDNDDHHDNDGPWSMIHGDDDCGGGAAAADDDADDDDDLLWTQTLFCNV